MYKDIGGEIITIGSDALSASRVGENIENINNVLKELGFKYVFTFNKRCENGILL